ncbi:MAG: phosphoribosylformylglycinamidine synthase subunit PurS [Acidobacteria bacterium]|nr:phosphoribosylformylglycinamidine synthase subunit PurS [Acidobacteriota bacterium]
MKARVYVSFKDSVLDPQGKAVKNALLSIGYEKVKDVRQGKFFQIEMDDMSEAEAKRQITEMAEKILSNPVIEKFEVIL